MAGAVHLPFAARRGAPSVIAVAGVAGLGLAMAWLPLKMVAVGLGGAAFLLALLVWPLISVYGLILLIPFSPLFAISAGGVRVGGMEALLSLGLAAGLLCLLLRRYIVPGGEPVMPAASIFGATSLLWPFLLFLAGVSGSWLTTLSLGASLVETAKWVEMLALYGLVVSLLPARWIKWAVAALLAAGLAQALLGLYQFVFKIGPDGFLLFGGRFLRAYGTFAQPNPYGGYLGLVLPLAVAVALWGLAGRGGSTQPFTPFHRQHAALLAGPALILLAGLLASQSRSAMLAFAVAGGLVFALHSKQTAALTAGAGLLAALILLAGTFEAGLPQWGGSGAAVLGRLADAGSIFTITDVATIEVTDANFATVERLAHWQAARAMWRDHPWLGVGFGNYAAVYPAYAVGRWLDPLGHAHNYLLNLGAETGLMGIIAYLIFWIWVFGVLCQTVRRAQGFNRAVAVGAVGIMAHLHVHNLFDNLYVQGMYLHVAVILALVAIIDRESRPTRSA